MTANVLIRGARRTVWATALAVVTAGVWACAPTATTRGNFPLAETVETIKQGKQNRDQIATLLGTPSSKATFARKETWFYIGERTEKFAFFDAKLLERKILVIVFDDRGTVASIRTYDASDGKNVALVERVTPTKGKELDVIEQIIGNIGRFSDGQEGQ